MDLCKWRRICGNGTEVVTETGRNTDMVVLIMLC